MSFLKHPQCTFCMEMNRFGDYNHHSNGFVYQMRPPQCGRYTVERPLLYCYDMTLQRQQHTPQYLRVLQDCSANRGDMQRSLLADKIVLERQNILERPDNNNSCSLVLCTCNEFINNNRIIQQNNNNKIYGRLQEVANEQSECTNKMNLVSQLNPKRDSIDSIGRSIDELPDNSIYSNGSLRSDPMCRFCHLSKNTQSDQLISPCYCCGTLKYVHQSCLKTWLEVSKKQRENNGNKPPHCELCNFKYVRKRKFQFGKIRQPKLSQNDCALHLIFLCSLLVMVTSASVTILCFAMEKSASNGNKVQFYDKSSLDGALKFSDRKAADISKSGNILCEYLSNLNLKDYSSSQRHSASKLSVICDLMLNKDRRNNNNNNNNNNENNLSADSSSQLSSSTLFPMPKSTATMWKRGVVFPSKHNNNNNNGGGGGRLWILTPEEAVTLASGVIFFIAFFIAMVVQVKSSYTCYQLVMQWVRLNYTHEVQSVQHHQNNNNNNNNKNNNNNNGVELKAVVNDGGNVKREYIERCVTEI